MSSSSSKPTAPPINPQQHALTIPPDIGNSNSHTPQTGSSSNNHPIPSHVLQYYLRGNHHNIASPSTPPQTWLAQNVYPLVTPMRIICFCVSQISFMLACGFFLQTEFYKTHVTGYSTSGIGHQKQHRHAPPLVFSVFVANVIHVVFLIFLLFFSFFFTAAYERYLHHDLLKSLGELAVMEGMSILISWIGHKEGVGVDHEIAPLLAMCVFLTVDSLCIIILLKPGHHYSLLDATLTLTLHLGLEGKGFYVIPATLFVFVILAIKNFLWRRIGHV